MARKPVKLNFAGKLSAAVHPQEGSGSATVGDRDEENQGIGYLVLIPASLRLVPEIGPLYKETIVEYQRHGEAKTNA